MRGTKHVLIAMAGAATLTAASVYAQSDYSLVTQNIMAGRAWSNGDSRVFGAMQSADHDRRRATEPVAIGTAELVRSRAASEFQAEAMPGRVREFSQTGAGVQVSVPVGSSNQVAGAATKPLDPRAAARTQAEEDKARAAGAVFYYLDAPVDRASGQTRPYITETQRAAEHARYEANKRRGAVATAARPSSEPARARVASAELGAQARSGISWSDSGRTDDRNAVAASAGGRLRMVAEQVVGNERANADTRAREILSSLH